MVAEKKKREDEGKEVTRGLDEFKMGLSLEVGLDGMVEGGFEISEDEEEVREVTVE